MIVYCLGKCSEPLIFRDFLRIFSPFCMFFIFFLAKSLYRIMGISIFVLVKKEENK